MKRIDVFLFHGIAREVSRERYYDEFVLGIRKGLSIELDVSFHPVDYSHILAEKEKIIFGWMRKFWHQRSRKWGCDYLVDILAMMQKDRPLEPGDAYYDIFQLFTQEYDKVAEKYPNSTKVLIGHSLGGQLGYIFTWRRPFDILITMGAPITWFAAAFKDFGQMNPNLRTWFNFWKKGDRVSSVVSENKVFASVHDIQVRSWNPFNYLTAFAHSAYWQSPFVHNEIAKILTDA